MYRTGIILFPARPRIARRRGDVNLRALHTPISSRAATWLVSRTCFRSSVGILGDYQALHPYAVPTPSCFQRPSSCQTQCYVTAQITTRRTPTPRPDDNRWHMSEGPYIDLVTPSIRMYGRGGGGVVSVPAVLPSDPQSAEGEEHHKGARSLHQRSLASRRNSCCLSESVARRMDCRESCIHVWPCLFLRKLRTRQRTRCYRRVFSPNSYLRDLSSNFMQRCSEWL